MSANDGDGTTSGEDAGASSGAAAQAFDPAEHRRQSLEGWEAAASGWARWRELTRRFGAPLAQRMIEAVAPQPGEAVLDIAAGLGDTGLLAAEQVLPDGHVTIGDQAEGMVAAARQRVQELQLDHVEVAQLNAEWLDLPTAGFDVVLCRWGVMLMADPSAALRELRRVLRPGGRIAIAVWDSAARNPWASQIGAVLAQRGLMPLPDEASGYRPGMFSLADERALSELMQDAGFLDVAVTAVALTRRHASFDELWASTLDLSPGLHDAVMSAAPVDLAQIEREIAARMRQFAAADGSLSIPASSLLALAEA